MKFYQILASGMTIILMASFVAAAAQGEIPITTKSKEALDLYLGGRDKLENIETVAAAEYFDRAIKKDPDFALAYLGRAFSGGGFNVYRENLEKAVKLSNRVSDGEKLLIWYNQAAADGQGDTQKKHLDQLLRLFPSDKRVQQNAGIYFRNIGEYNTALTHLKKAVSIDSKYAPVYNTLGYCQKSLGNYEAAEEAFKTYISLIPDRPNPYDSYAELLLKQGRFEASIQQYQKALTIDPGFVNAYQGIGDNYIFLGDYAKAREYYQKEYHNSPEINGKLRALFWKRVSYLHEGDVAKAIDAVVAYRSLADMENLVPVVIGSYFQEAFILTENRELGQATTRLETGMKMIQMARVSEPVIENLKVDGMTAELHLLIAKGDIDSARVLAERCYKIVQNRNNPNELKNLNSLMAMLEMKQGNYTRAMDYFSQADQNDPYNWYYMATAYEKMNDDIKAVELTEKITTYNENSFGLSVVRQQAQMIQKDIRAKAMK